MGYSREIYASAEHVLAQRKKDAEEAAQKRKTAFYRRCPDAEKIERIISSTAIAAAKAVLTGRNAKEQLLQLKRSNQRLQQEYARLLQEAGYAPNYLEPRYGCEECGDTGYVDGRMCGCMKKLLREESYRRLNALTPLSLSTFESFRLEFYSAVPEGEDKKSPRAQMEGVFANCRRYAESFSLAHPSMILQGGTGLGKTHMSLAIANEVIRKGFGVVYCSVNNLITQLEREHFGRDEGDTEKTLLECDLLILDDLGTEFRSSFSVAEIYNIVNTRLMMQKPTIISTNLSFDELQERYSERFASRILGNYARNTFVGRDNRQQNIKWNAKKAEG